MAIDEHDMFAGVADDPATTPGAGASVDAAVEPAAGDELRHRLDTPLFGREPGSMSSAQVPGLRELTWDHVTNPTSSIPVVPGESIFGETDGAPRPSPLRLDEVLARRDVGLKPIEPMTPVFGDPGATPPNGAPRPAPDPGPMAAPPAPPDAAAAAAPVAPLPAIDRAAPAKAPLPSFAEILAAPPSGVVTDGGLPEPYARADAAGVDSLVKPIEEPPPVARETDPLVDGLAELIVRSTPSVGMPRVTELREVSRGDTGMTPVVGRSDPPVLDAAVEFAAVSTAVPVVTDEPEPVITTGTQAAVPGAEVEAEMNRLAFLPDQDDATDGPVEVPEIAYSDVRGVDPAPAPISPVLSSGEMYVPRNSSAPIRHNYTDILNSTVVPVVPKRKRHLVRNVLSLLVLLGLVGGGLFAVKHFVLDKVKWTADLEPLAKQVENVRGLSFEESVTVTALPPEDYAQRIVAAAGYGPENKSAVDAELRILGLASGEVDRTAAGLVAMVDSPAFYDPVDGVIYQVAGLPTELQTFALHRALAMALLDQRFGWSERLAAQPAVNTRGTRALYDADALAVANELIGDDDGLRATLGAQVITLFKEHVTAPTPSTFLSVVAGRTGVALWPYMANLSLADRDLLETDAVVTDAKVLDVRRLLQPTAEAPAEPTSRGMLFWYHVLASRVDANTAWVTALAWRSDNVTTNSDRGPLCTTAEVTFDEAALSNVNTAFLAWAAAAPKPSTTKVTVLPANSGVVTVEIEGCDPGPSATTSTQAFRLSLGGAPLRAAQFAATAAANPDVSGAVVACAVFGSDKVTVEDDRGVIDPTGVWARVAAHPAPDLAAARCAAAG